MHPNAFNGQPVPGPAGGAYSAPPRSPSLIEERDKKGGEGGKGGASKGRGEEEKEGRRKGWKL